MDKYKKLKQSDKNNFSNNIAKTFGQPTQFLNTMTSDDYFNICAICYKAIYYADYTRNKTPIELYLRNRCIGYSKASIKEINEAIERQTSIPILKSEYRKPSKFKEFVKNGYGIPFHDFEIIYGKVYLDCKIHKNKFYVHLYNRTRRDTEVNKLTILMYNALIKNNIPVLYGYNQLEE